MAGHGNKKIMLCPWGGDRTGVVFFGPGFSSPPGVPVPVPFRSPPRFRTECIIVYHGAAAKTWSYSETSQDELKVNLWIRMPTQFILNHHETSTNQTETSLQFLALQVFAVDVYEFNAPFCSTVHVKNLLRPNCTIVP